MALLEIQHLSKRFIERSSIFHKHDFYAVKDVSFTLNRRETLAIIGENGSGKSTLAKMIIGQVEPTSGQMLFRNKPLAFGDYARNERIFQTLKLVGLYKDHVLTPISLASNSQKQLVALARALILEPEILIIDDTSSTLDFSVKTQMINLMLELQQRLALSFIYIGQHLGLIKHISDKLLVMHEGEILEYGTTKEVLLRPQHAITERLIESHFGKKLTMEAWAE